MSAVATTKKRKPFYQSVTVDVVTPPAARDLVACMAETLVSA